MCRFLSRARRSWSGSRPQPAAPCSARGGLLQRSWTPGAEPPGGRRTARADVARMGGEPQPRAAPRSPDQARYALTILSARPVTRASDVVYEERLLAEYQATRDPRLRDELIER